MTAKLLEARAVPLSRDGRIERGELAFERHQHLARKQERVVGDRP